MSSIWGVIDFNSDDISKVTCNKFEEAYSVFKIDRMEGSCHGNAYMGAGIQYITKESENEILPYYDKVNRNLFTADAYLDNRNELIQELTIGHPFQITDPETSVSTSMIPNVDTPDGMLIYLAYLKWGVNLCDHLLGVFAFAIYDYDNNEFYLFVDHCGDRCIHYYIKNDQLIFSTLIKPVLEATDHSIEVSEKYIAACESNLSADMVVFPGLSPYEGVYQLLAGQYLKVTLNEDKTVSYTTISYWDPIRDVEPLNLPNDSDYKKLFLETYTKCVTDTLRVNGKKGSFLSSGLDSSSVASLAAIRLQETGEELHTYTSVPLSDYTPENNGRLANEKEPVEKFCKAYSNIIPKYISCEGKSALTEMQRFVSLFCSPIKYSVNAVWMDEIYKTAAADGCKLLLTGQHGNCTVSSGGLITRLWYEFKALHFMTMIRQYRAFSHSFKINRKLFLQDVLSNLSEYIHPTVSLDTCLTREDLIKKYSLKNVYLDNAKYMGSDRIFSEIQRRRSIFLPNSFQQVSYANAIFELCYGIISRDPTRDKRMIELCMAMPIRCFCDGKFERRLITDYMKDIVPKHIIRQMYNRGIQSADFVYRLRKNYMDYTSIFEANRQLLDKYINTQDLNFDPDDRLQDIQSLNQLSLLLFLLK